jgi:hypothetical protein
MPLFAGPPDVAKLKAERDIAGLIKALQYRGSKDVRRPSGVSAATRG